MRYIVNADNYITAVSFGCQVECQDDGCTEYTGSVPEGYTSLEDWYAEEVEKLYRWKIVNGELTLDSSASAPLEGYAPKAADLNEVRSTCRVSIGQDTANSPILYGVCDCIKWEGDRTVQIAHSVAAEGSFSRYSYGESWTDWVRIDPTAFAPSGFGLGGSSNAVPYLADMHTRPGCGWFYTNPDTANCPVRYSYGITLRRMSSECIHLGFDTNYDNTGIYIVKTNDGGATWVTEWVNPPLIAGYEYRTTERYKGQPVYYCLMPVGYVSAGNNNFTHGLSVSRAIGISLVNNNVEDVTGYSGVTSLTFDTSAVHLSCTNAFGDIAALLKYTK